MPKIITRAVASADGYGFGSRPATAAVYVENVFSTYLYTGTGAAQTITNNIPLSTSGGMVWIKDRTNAYNHNIFDTVTGATKLYHSNTSSIATTDANSLTSFNTTGFTLGSGSTSGNEVNVSSDAFVSWSFLKQPKFFDIVTYTGNGTSQVINHNLGSTPGCILVKCTSASNQWVVYHVGTGSGAATFLSSTSASTNGNYWSNTAPTSTNFTVGSSGNNTNDSGKTYIAYLFASNAGGFGLTGTDNVISCGSFTTDGSGNATVNLGYEPQWIMWKDATSNDTVGWGIYDTMRGWNYTDAAFRLRANSSGAESQNNTSNPSATGFTINVPGANDTYIYIAIRRGPMAVPTDATKVFKPVLYVGNDSNQNISGQAYPTDLVIPAGRDFSTGSFTIDRLRSATQSLATPNATAEATSAAGFDISSINQNGFSLGPANSLPINQYPYNYVAWQYTRAPKFFDEVCYTGTGSATTINHNLTVSPELIIVKKRSTASTTGWLVGAATVGYTNKLYLNLTLASSADSTAWNSTSPTSTVFSIGTNTDCNASGATFVAYLFATCAGVSKVGSYTGTGATQTIACGFTGGARFVMIKRTNSTGDWYVWDTARGMVSGTDPSLLLNSTAAEVNANSIYTTTGGFQIVSTAAGINASGGNYIFLAIA